MGLAVAAVPYLWVLFDLWNGSFDLLRTAESNGYASNFYDLQARAIFHGHLYAAGDAFGGETFLRAGHKYTYFGLFPSLLRMPVLALTHSLDGRLTALSMLLAWLVTALFSSLLIWRVRPLIRGNAVMGRAEAASYGVLLATIMGGSVLVYLASDPWVFSEDLAWSVALTIGSMFALLGVLERPSWGRVIASGAVIMAASLTRASTGDACVIGAVLVALWFAIGRGGAANRRWWPWVLASGLVPLAVGCAITWAKFGILFGYPASEQIVFAALLSQCQPVRDPLSAGQSRCLLPTDRAPIDPGVSIHHAPPHSRSWFRRCTPFRSQSGRERAGLYAASLLHRPVGSGQRVSPTPDETVGASSPCPCRIRHRLRHRPDLRITRQPVCG